MNKDTRNLYWIALFFWCVLIGFLSTQEDKNLALQETLETQQKILDMQNHRIDLWARAIHYKPAINWRWSE